MDHDDEVFVEASKAGTSFDSEASGNGLGSNVDEVPNGHEKVNLL